MIGLKSVAALAIAAILVAIAALRGALDPNYLAHLSGAAAFAVGLVASATLGLVAAAWRPDVASRGALAWRDHRLAVVEVTTLPAATAASKPAPTTRELPALVQRALLFAGFVAIALGALTNHAAARIAELPDRFSEPSPSTYCLPAKAKAKAEPEAPPLAGSEANVEQSGCALVKRAFALGYAKSLGTCAPKTVAAALPKPAVVRDVCTRRQLDEPFLHYGARRVAEAFAGATERSPVDVAEHRIAAINTHVAYLGSLVADIRHAITGTPHAAHHLWTNLPDPHPRTLRDRFAGAPRCSTRFASLPLWPAWHAGQESELVEHVLGQLLFATRFGSTASCNDYVIHWDAAADACAHPDQLLGDRGLRDVLDRRQRQVDLVALAIALGREPPPAPPPVAAVVSLQCLIVDPAAPPHPVPTATTVDDTLVVRALRVPAIRSTDDGPIDVYLELAALFAGPGTTAANTAGTPAMIKPEDVAGDDYVLAHLDPLVAADPFASREARWPLAHGELADVYPIERHLHAFVDAFRRRYLAQRGRL